MGLSHWRRALRGLIAGCQHLSGLTAPSWPQALRGYTQTGARCQCFLPSLPTWQAGMTRSKLDVVGACHVVVQPFSSKPRVGSGLPACSQDLPARLVTPLQENHLPSPGKGLIPPGFSSLLKPSTHIPISRWVFPQHWQAPGMGGKFQSTGLPTQWVPTACSHDRHPPPPAASPASSSPSSSLFPMPEGPAPCPQWYDPWRMSPSKAGG